MASTELHLDPQRAAQAAEMIKALGHPIRLRIIAILSHRDRHVTALSQLLEAHQSIVSQQLRILRIAGLVEVVRADRHSVYRLAKPRLRDLVHCLEGCSV
jgi:ArsR family transcriptional regulator